MWIHLNPIGGIAGDMFIAALLDVFPEMKAGLFTTLDSFEIPKTVDYTVDSFSDHAISGTKFLVSEASNDGEVKNTPGSYKDIIHYIENSAGDKEVSEIAKTIFFLLAEAESYVHKVKIDNLSFHELGEWDSIVDIIGASFFINALDANWSFGEVPLGGGSVLTEHGKLPVPAPATCYLLEDFEIYDDGVMGERVTPTGAAILKFLRNHQSVSSKKGILKGSGVGFGTKRFNKLANILRVLVFNDKQSESSCERVGRIEFEVDDQTPEHLSIAIGKIRQHPGVLDVLQQTGSGKKGRVVITLKIICKQENMEEIIGKCFLETNTLGARYAIMDRLVLDRQIEIVNLKGHKLRVKLVFRGDQVAGKVEADDLKRVALSQSDREKMGNEAVLMAIEKWKKSKKDYK